VRPSVIMLSLVAICLGLAQRSAAQQVTETPLKTQEKGQANDASEADYAFLKIHHVRQQRKLCATASASMVLSHYGVDMDQVLIKQLARSVSKRPQFPGTYYVDLVNGLATKGIHWKRNPHPTTARGFTSGIKAIRESLFAGRPVIVDTNLAPNGHTIVVNGIDPRRKLISVVDPNQPAPGRRTYTYQQFEKIWRSKTIDVRGSILTFPPSESEEELESADG